MTDRPAATTAPMTPEQRRLWYLDQYEETGAVHLINQGWWLTGPLDEAALDSALTVLVRRHELLRSVCVPTPDGARLLIRPAPDSVLAAEEPSSPDAVAARRAALAGTPLSLTDGPLFTAHLLREDTGRALLLLRVHHLVADGWSIEVLTRELSILYTPGAPADPGALEPLPLAAADVPAALRSAADSDGESAQEAAAYWRDTLRGAPEALDLPYDHPRPARPTYAGDRSRLLWPPGTAERLKAVAAQQGATFFVALYSVLAGFLSRIADQDDLVIGVPVADRPGEEFEPLVGFFVNTLPVRIGTDGDPALGELVARAADSFFEGCVHRGLPFDGIVRAAAPPRVPGRTPLFQVLCVLQNTLGAELELAGAEAGKHRVDQMAAAFDLTVEFWQEADGRLAAMVEYATELFTLEHGRRLSDRLAVFLAAWASDPGLRLGEVPLLLPGEEDATSAGGPAGTDVPGDVVEDIVARLDAPPDRVAARSSGRMLTGRQLLDRVGELRNALSAAGVVPGSRVGVRLPRGTDTVAALLAVLTLDAVYVPLDARLPAERLRMIESAARLRAVLTPAGAEPVRTPSVEPVRAGSRDPAPPGPVDGRGDRDAYVFFTSGSSGTPKGVLVGRKALTNLVREWARFTGLGPGDSVAAATATTFDVSLPELLAPLLAGCTVEVADDRAAEDPTLLAELVAHTGVTVLQATPSVWRLLLDHLTVRPRVALAGGEALPRDLKDRLLTAADTVFNVYGPTETTVWSTVWRCAPGPVTVGTALARTELHVVDRHLRPMPPGCRGELLIGGVGLARGYLGHDDLTARQFVVHDFGYGPRRWYRTGDIASRDEDGRVRLHGRRDAQIKLRGHRVEPGEIEARARQCPGVAQCAVVPFDRNGQSGLAAFLVGPPGTAPDPAQVRAHLSSVLPAYMVPALLLSVPELPRLSSGKTDTRALLTEVEAHLAESPEAGRPADDGPEDCPVTEAVLLALQAVLRKPVAPHTSFFDQGGDSLGAARALALLRKALDIPLHMSDFVAAPSVRQLADVIRSRPGATDAARAAVAAVSGPQGATGGGLARGLLSEEVAP
ncbi:amino acid adenylation domain-containing protein [Actinacidiphila yanglinensis]|uniref:Amino acid adenylation domain-containing protein n=1 Tax=Actinacidiphila yanglinensis TaxID=310779 RepID=A0A1H6EB99_9ACTN|nr:non-ribosomal peptide synthetase [Actinacidiphila yanglinensis]SEG94204.1 amino acid adenylation domain-containing protein [Actinacidiphila yanglinensis]